ncbi:MAG TPA: hypothetical protein VLC79_03020 [Cellvibrio sp.]|nr:hypothetical protein [Cellvibrio sp.]
MEKNYVDAIKKLVDQYYKHEISCSEYRMNRKRLIDQMDVEFNGSDITNKIFAQSPIDQS